MNVVKRYLMTLCSCLYVICSVDAQGSEVVFNVTDLPVNTSMTNVGVRGSNAPLTWEKTLFFSGNEVSILFPDSLNQVEYKYVIDNGKYVQWEDIENRFLSLDSSVILKDVWNKYEPIDVSKIAKITPENLQKDFLLIKEMFLNVHPGTYRYNDSIDISKALSDLKIKLEKSLSVGEAYLAFSKLTAQLMCDHTKVGFNNQGRIVNAIIHQQNDKLPFTFKWFNKKMIVDQNASENQKLVKGVEILSINGESVQDIFDELMQYVAADGNTYSNRAYKLQVDGYDFRYNAFDVFFPLAYPMGSNEFALEINNLKNTKSKIKVKGISREERAQVLNERYEDFPLTRDDMWKFEIKNGIGFLTLNSFGLMGWKAMTLDYKNFLNNAFNKLENQKIDKLIIDIRKNTGGMDEMKKELFSYLPFSRDEIIPTERDGRTRYINFPHSLKPHVKTWSENPWFHKLEPDSTDGIYYVFKERMKNRLPISAKSNVFKGQVILLVGAANTSLAFYTARDFQHFKIGKLVGGETGGNLRDINGGQILFLTLPNSGIEIDFPVMGGFSKRPMPNSGVKPDYEIHTTLDDFMKGNDPQLQKAIQLIEQ